MLTLAGINAPRVPQNVFSIAPRQASDWKVMPVMSAGDSLDVESPVELPWDSLARLALPSLNFAEPDTALLARQFYEPGAESEFPFAAPLLTKTPREHYSGLSLDGPVRLEPVRLAGLLRFNTRPPEWKVEGEPQAFGYVRLTRAAPGSGSAVYFVHWSASAPSFTTVDAEIAHQGDSLRVTVALRAGRATWTLPGDDNAREGSSAVARARIFVDATSRRTFLLVHLDYGQNGNPCLWYAAVFDVTSAPERLTFTGVCDA